MTTFLVKKTPEFWTCVQNNPRQRNTEEHADRIEAYLQKVTDQHAVVAAAQLPDGTLIKLDGHTRGQLWEQNRIPVPVTVYIQIYPARDLDHAGEMYDLYDNKITTKHAKDGIFGAFREAGVTMRSPFMAKCRLASALRNVCEFARGESTRGRNGWDVRAATLEWISELVSLDNLLVETGTGGSPARLHSGVVGAMLLSIRKYGIPRVEDFWHQYLVKETGMTNEPAMKMREILGSLNKGTGGRDTAVYLASKALSCLEHHMAGNTIIRVYGVNLTKYLTANTKYLTRTAATQRKSADTRNRKTAQDLRDYQHASL